MSAYPWTVGLVDYSQSNHPFCGGSLISDQFVITAAHCVYKKQVKDITVILGTHNINQVNEKRDVQEIIIHRKYSKSKTVYSDFGQYKVNGEFYDIALIRMKQKVVFRRNISPICLPSSNQRNFSNLFVAGWGTTDPMDPNSTSELLRETEVREWSSRRCMIPYSRFSITWRTLCANMENKDSCNGDSGGPLMTRVQGNIYLAGIVSYGKELKCGLKSIPGIYTRVSSFSHWVRNRVQDVEVCSHPFNYAASNYFNNPLYLRMHLRDD